MNQLKTAFLVFSIIFFVGCGRENTPPLQKTENAPKPGAKPVSEAPKKTAKTVHVFVALCDNENQGIVRVPDKLGNGEDPENNLYWGARYGVKTFLKTSASWKLLAKRKNTGENILESLLFIQRRQNIYLVADAYRGKKIKQAIEDFLAAAAGHNPLTLNAGQHILGFQGAADLVVYVGHNGLMDFAVEKSNPPREGGGREAIVLACKSKPYFRSRLVSAGSTPVLLTTGFMAPEAYTLDAAVRSWSSGANYPKIKEQAAIAYHKYQNCGMTAARRLFYAGPKLPD